MSATQEETRERIMAVAELLGLTPQQLLAAAQNAGTQVAAPIVRQKQKPPPIVYPNIDFEPYEFREFPKIVYRGYIRDVEETVTKLIPREGGGVDQRTFIRVIPDQFVQETMEINSRAEEATLTDGWYFTRAEAIDAAKAAKATQRPIVEREVRQPRRRETEAAA